MTIINGRTRMGRGFGRQIGFPTLNIPYSGVLRGVFAAKVFLNGVWCPAAVNLGGRPTFDDDSLCCEAYLIDWCGDVGAGTVVKIELLEKIRDVKKFANPDDLKKQIKKDIQFAKMSLC